MNEKNKRVPRYSKPGFVPIRTPDSPGMIKGWLGAKIFDGVYKLPEQVELTDEEWERLAKAQALADYNGVKGRTPAGNKEMAEIYGDVYLEEIKRLQTAARGPSATRAPKKPWQK